MSKHTSPLLGYNNNVRHKGRVFHIQTEDSGIKRPHVITHLFMDGGRILKSIKTSYAEHVGSDNLADTVRAMMKEQHKAMVVALREGQFDHMLESRPSMAPPPAATDAPPPAAESDAAVSKTQAAAAVSKAPAATAVSKAPAATAVSKAPAATAVSKAPAATAVSKAPAPAPSEVRTAAAAEAPPHPPSEPIPATERDPEEAALTLDLDALGAAPVVQPPGDLPPPPANLFRDRTRAEPGTGGRYRTLRDPRVDPESSGTMRAAAKVEAPELPPQRIDHVDLNPQSRPASRSDPKSPASTRDPRAQTRKSTKPPSPPPSERGGRKSSSRPPKSQQGDGRYAPARPAAIFGQAKPQSSIFGEDLISDKSLDEVILSYLAEDLDGDK
jgi:hypothetical protein